VLNSKSYEDAAKGTVLILADIYKNMKSNPYYEFNPDDNTVFGNVPIRYAIAREYNKGSLREDDIAYLKAGQSDYSDKVFDNMDVYLNNPKLPPVFLDEINVTPKKGKGGEAQGDYLAEGDEIVEHYSPVGVYSGGYLQQLSNNFSKIKGNKHSAPSGGVEMSGGDYIYSDQISLPENFDLSI